MKEPNPFKYYKTSPEVIRLAVMYYVRYPLSFRHVEDILHERGIDICYETVRYWVERFGGQFIKEIRKKGRIVKPRANTNSFISKKRFKLNTI